MQIVARKSTNTHAIATFALLGVFCNSKNLFEAQPHMSDPTVTFRMINWEVPQILQ